MRMNSLSGLLKRAEVNISIANQALDAKDPYEAGEVHDELQSITSDLKMQKIILSITNGTISEDLAIDDMINQIESIQIQLEKMADQLGEDYDYKDLLDGGE